jgi:ribosomal protein S20
LAARVLDRAARKGLIHKNNAARQKSRLAALVKKLKAKVS